MENWQIREELLLGSDALTRLSRAHVAVFGIGGVGGFTTEALARAGIGRLTLIDDDKVSPSNLNRQIVALQSTLGVPKAAVMAARVRDINPDCLVTPIIERYTDETHDRFFSMGFDYVADAIDAVRDKVSLIQTALSRGVPIISAMGTGAKLDPTKFEITDLFKTSGCPLARVMRHELRKLGVTHHTVLYSPELPSGEHTVVPGSVSWVPSCAGLMLAGHIVLSLAKLE